MNIFVALQSELQAQEKELAKLEAGEEEHLQQLRCDLVVSAGAFHTIITRLCALSEFWKSVSWLS